MLRLMARYADVVSIGFGRELDDLRIKLEYLQEQCAGLNRPYEEIEKTTFFTPSVTRDGRLDPAALDAIAALAELGFDEIMVRQAPVPPTFEILATELIPLVTHIPVAGR
jgi:hypothetical protein